MATFLPDKLNMTEYKPSMVGIPTQSVARLYDRLDKQAYAADAQSNKIKTALAAQIAEASPNDAPYLQNMYNSVEGLIDQAKEEKNLPGYANQIRNMVGDMYSDQDFANIQANNVLAKQYARDKEKMIMTHGAENVIEAGDNPLTFSSRNPETGEPQRFMGQVTKRFDYTAAMMDLFKTKTDPLENKEQLHAFIYDLGDAEDGSEAFKALQAYRDTPEGRVHINDLSNQMFEMPFIRLAPENAMEVEAALNQKLENAGLLQMNSSAGGTRAGTQAWDDKGIYKEEFDKAIVSSGPYGSSLTDGTSKEDQTLQTFSDGTTKSVMDQQIFQIFKNKGQVNSVTFPGADQAVQIDGAPIDPTRVKGGELTNALSPSGNPIIALQLNAISKQKDGSGEHEAASAGIAYVEVMPEEMRHIQGSSFGLINQVVNNASTPTTEAFMPLLASIGAPLLGPYIMNEELAAVELYNVRSGGLTVKREGKYHVPYDEAGKPIKNENGAPYRFASPSELRLFVGREYLKYTGIKKQ